MPRVSREQARANRAAMVDAAGRLLREGGPAEVTVEAVSARAGMTRGSFYKQFASRRALMVEALDHARVQRRDAMAAAEQKRPDRTIASFADVYLSQQHRDNPGDGCVVAAVAGHTTDATGDDLREGVVRALDDLLAALSVVAPEHDQEALLADAAVLVGALQLARATAGTPRSDAVLQAARRALSDPARGRQVPRGEAD